MTYVKQRRDTDSTEDRVEAVEKTGKATVQNDEGWIKVGGRNKQKID